MSSATTGRRIRNFGKISLSRISLKTRDGATATVKLADKAPIRTVVKKSVADVKQGLFVGITAMPQPDGTQKAVEIHIFPEALRGTIGSDLGRASDRHFDEFQRSLHTVAAMRAVQQVLV